MRLWSLQQHYKMDFYETSILQTFVLGSSKSGKTCLMGRFADEGYSEAYFYSTQIDLRTVFLEISGERIRLNLWDGTYIDRFRTLLRSYFRGKDGFYLVYDVTSRDSFSEVGYWLSMVRQHAVQGAKVLLVGCKIDLGQKRCVSFEEGKSYADMEGLLFIETSAHYDTNTKAAMAALAAVMLQNARSRRV